MLDEEFGGSRHPERHAPAYEELGDCEIVESESLRPDKRATLNGGEVVGHRTWVSFSLAVGPPELPCTTCNGFADAPDHVRGCPRVERISAAQARAGLRAAFRIGPTTFRERQRAGQQLPGRGGRS